MLITPLFTLTPVAMAVAAAAESGMLELAEFVLVSARYGNSSKDSVPSVPFAYIAAAFTCSNPMPSPMKRITFVGCEKATGTKHGSKPAMITHGTSKDSSDTPQGLELLRMSLSLTREVILRPDDESAQGSAFHYYLRKITGTRCPSVLSLTGI